MKNFLLFISLLLCANSIVKAQLLVNGKVIHKCYAEEQLLEMAKKNPAILAEREKQEEAFQKEIEAYKTSKLASSVPKIIPTVFHILHVGGNENISKAQVLSQIQSLNEDFSFTNADTAGIPAAFRPICGNANIEFRLAKLDPSGNCTEGITRTYTNLTNGTFERDNLKSIIQWPPNKYFNVWVVKDIASSAGSSIGTILGYAQFPGTGSATTDGVVVRHDEIGTVGTSLANLTSGPPAGRTLTHEIGHWLNLRHIWGDNGQCNASDLCADTPPARGGTASPAGCNYGCASYPLNANTCTRPHGVGGANVTNTLGDMFFNYMDYSDGNCLKAFSNDQCIRMNAALNSTTSNRNNLSSSANLIATGVNNVTIACKAKPYILPFETQVLCENTNITLLAKTYNGVATTNTWTLPGANFVFGTTTSDSIIVNYPSTGTYSVKLVSSNSVGNDSLTDLKKIVVLKGTAQALYGPNWFEGFENATNFNTDWTIINNDNDNPKFQVTNITSFSGTKCLFINNFQNFSSQFVDEIISPNLNMTGTTGTGFKLKFRYAYQSQNSTDDDKLELYSTANNCGAVFFGTPRLSRTANGVGVSDLNPQPGAVNGSYYVPTPGDLLEWKEVVLTNLFGLVNQSNARLKFIFKSGNGNNLFIDDIKFETNLTIGILDQALSNGSFDLSPNPSTTSSTLSYSILEKSDVNITLHNLIGQKIETVFSGNKNAGDYNDVLNLTNYNAGVYILNMNVNGITTTKKLVIE